MDLESIMLSEISQRKTNPLYYRSYVESKKINECITKETHREQINSYKWGERREGEMGVMGPEVQTAMHKIDKV